MDRDVRAFIGGWFSVESGRTPEEIRRGVRQSAPAFQERLRHDLAQILRDRELSVDDVWDGSWLVDNNEDFYQGLHEAYDLLFASADG